MVLVLEDQVVVLVLVLGEKSLLRSLLALATNSQL